MRSHLVAVVVLLCSLPSHVKADGCKYKLDGRAVPEHEQRALVEWENGSETLHIAALSEPTTDSTVWIVPIRARAMAIRAEPVEEFPAVTYYEPLISRTRKRLQDAIKVTAALNSGGLCCPFLGIGGCGGAAPKAEEVSRVERLGMVVTVVRADSRDDLARYLDAQGVNRVEIDLKSLEPYFGQNGFAFVCGWVSKRDEPSTAAALQIAFPSPNLWFPLLATRVYTNPVRTVVYVRGFVKPADGCNLEGLACEYVYGYVEPKGVSQAFKNDGVSEHSPYFLRESLKPLTRVTLTTDTQKWDRDLELVPGTTSTGTAALVVTEWLGNMGLPLSALLGAVLGLAIPWTIVPRAERRWHDWIAGALIGASILGSIWNTALVFSIWRGIRFRDPWRANRYLVLPLLAMAHFGIVYTVCRGLIYAIAGS